MTTLGSPLRAAAVQRRCLIPRFCIPDNVKVRKMGRIFLKASNCLVASSAIPAVLLGSSRGMLPLAEDIPLAYTTEIIPLSSCGGGNGLASNLS
jgi:hypothetical protein